MEVALCIAEHQSPLALDTMLTDLRRAIRQYLQAPGFAFVATCTLALGIGANSALFSVADSMFFRPRPGVHDAEGLVWVSRVEAGSDRAHRLSYPAYERIRREVPAFPATAGVINAPFSLSTPGAPVRVDGQVVAGDFFDMLRVRFAAGRAFNEHETRDSSAPVVVLSYHTWTSHFDGDPAVIGRQVIVNGTALTVIGVTEAGFNGAEHQDQRYALWVPAAQLTTLFPEWSWMLTATDGGNVRMIARLAPGTPMDAANAPLQRVAALMSEGSADSGTPWSFVVHPASAGVPPGSSREITQLTALSIAVTGLVLLVACANVSSLLLARSLTRRRELAIRLAIGASRARLVRQLLTESVVLAAAASLAGVLLATWSTELLLATALPLPLVIELDWRMFLFSVAIAVVTGVTFGLVPALHATRREVALTIREGSAGGDPRRSRLQGAFVVAQVAFSLVLLVTCGLFVRSLQAAARLDLGFDAGPNVLAVSFDLGLQRYDGPRASAFVDQLVERTRTLPDFVAASVSNAVPLAEWAATPVHLDAAEFAAAADTTFARDIIASFFVTRPGFFETLGIPLLRGRDFTDADASGAPRVAIINQSFVDRHFEGREPLGRRVSIDGPDGPFHTVVGVVADAITTGLRSDGQGAVYVAQRQHPSVTGLTLLVRTGGPAGPLGAQVVRLVRALEPNLPVHRVRTLDQVRDDALAEQRSGSAVIGIMGLLALGLATVGLYAVIVFAVRQRTREIGIRMALGARQDDVVRMFVGRGLQLTLIGLLIGLAISVAATQAVRSMLFGVTPTDPVAFVGVTAVFVGVAILACWLPARRAALVDPVTTMRTE